MTPVPTDGQDEALDDPVEDEQTDEPDGEPDDEPTGARRMATDSLEAREAALAAASMAVQRGELVVLPTDTVYGIGADAFDAEAVQSLLDAKGRGREMPPPVLISSATTLDASTASGPGR
jgi:hypothetical protein